MPKVAPKEDYILLFEDTNRYNIDLSRYNDLQNTIKALSIELEARFRKPLRKELDEIVQSKDISKAVQEFITDYYNNNGTPITMSFYKVVELMELDLTKIYQFVDNIKGKQKLIFKEPQIESYRYYARTPEQIARYKKLTKIVSSIKELYEENKTGLSSGFLPRFAVGSSNALLTNGIDLSINYRFVLNGASQ